MQYHIGCTGSCAQLGASPGTYRALPEVACPIRFAVVPTGRAYETDFFF